MIIKRRLVFLPAAYSKVVVNSINDYFDKGYEIEDRLDGDDGCYLLLVLKSNSNYASKFATKPEVSDDNYTLIEEYEIPDERWVRTTTEDTKVN